MNDPLRAQQMVRRQVRRRRRWRRLRVFVLVVMASTTVVAAAIGIDRLAIVVHKFYDEHHHTNPQAVGTTHPSTSTTATTPPGPPRCGSAQLSAVVSDWRDTGTSVEETVALTNIAALPCTVAGYPVVGAAAQDGTSLPAPNVDTATFGPPPTAGTTIPVVTTIPVGTTVPPSPITLAHAARATFELTYDNVCDHVLVPGQPATGAAGECYPGIWLEVTPTAGSSPLIVTVPLHLTYSTAGFNVGPIQAGSGTPLTGRPPLTAQTYSPTGSPTSP